MSTTFEQARAALVARIMSDIDYLPTLRVEQQLKFMEQVALAKSEADLQKAEKKFTKQDAKNREALKSFNHKA